MATLAYCAGWACWLAVLCVRLDAAPQSGRADKPNAEPPAGSTATPTFGTTVVIPSGLRGDIYELRRGAAILPDFDRLRRKPVGAVWTTTLDVPPRHWRDGFPGVTRRHEWFAINYTGRFWIEKPGRYRFALLSDDGSRLYIDDQLVIDNDCLHSPDVRSATVTLSGGVHRIRVPYFQGPRDCVALILAVAAGDGHWRIFSTDEFKPPPNPEDWGHSVSDLPLRPEPGEAPLAVNDLIGDLSELGAKSTANGCLAAPVRDCGK